MSYLDNLGLPSTLAAQACRFCSTRVLHEKQVPRTATDLPMSMTNLPLPEHTPLATLPAPPAKSAPIPLAIHQAELLHRLRETKT